MCDSETRGKFLRQPWRVPFRPTRSVTEFALNLCGSFDRGADICDAERRLTENLVCELTKVSRLMTGYRWGAPGKLIS